MPHRGEDLIFEVVQVAVDRRGRSPHIIGIMQLVNLEMAPGIGDGCLSYPLLGCIDLGAKVLNRLPSRFLGRELGQVTDCLFR